MQKISFTVDGRKLAGAIFYPEKPKEKNPAILFVQGWTGEKERSYQYSDALSKLGYICFLFDNLGHGENEGDIKSFTIKDFFEGVLAAYDHLLGINGVDKENISAVGSSFGGYLIALLSEKRKLINIVLRAPAGYPNEVFERLKYTASGTDNPDLFEWRKKQINPDENFALKAVSIFSGNILIIQSENDNSVPEQTIKNYINATKNKNNLIHIIVRGAPHSIEEGLFRDEVTRILVDWFRKSV